MTIVAEAPPAVDALEVTAGVDTHADDHVAAVIDPLGRHLGDRSFPATPAGYQALVAWITTHGAVIVVGVEGTGAYGAGLTRALTAAGLAVVEVDRPDRKARRDQGKSDPIDAYAAARAAASGRARGTPKTRTGDDESIRALRVARNGAVRARAKALTQLKALIVTAPAELRSQLAELDGARLVGTCARLRPTRHEATAPSIHARRAPRPGRLVDPLAATKRALASIAGRIGVLNAEIAGLDDDPHSLLTPLAPTLLVSKASAWTSPASSSPPWATIPAGSVTRRRSLISCGAAPIPASSGKTTRHRLNRGGDRAANAALYRIVVCRLRWDPATRAYVDRRTKEGRSKAEIIRCLKRYVAREVFTAIRTDFPQKPLDDA